MIYRRGDEVMVDHPFSDARGTKVRPMLIVQSDVRNRLLNNSVAAMLTTNLSFVGADPTQILVDITSPDGAKFRAQCELRHTLWEPFYSGGR